MKFEQYVSLIKRLEEAAKHNPKSYRLKVKMFAALGYAYILAIIAIPIFCLLLIVAAVWIKPAILLLLIKALGKLVLVLAVFVGGIFTAFFGAIRAFLREVAVPNGIRISREVSPKFFDLIDEICVGIDSPKPDEVLIIPDFNASVMTVPRFGFFGNKTYLNIGLPLMESVSSEHIRSILAHEMGHISKQHGSDSAWIYQLRETWSRFLEQQETAESSSFDFLYTSFINWYFPYFNAYSFVLAREQERDADQMAAKLYGEKSLAESLIVTQIRGEFLDSEYWKEIFEKAKTDRKPPKNVFSGMQVALRSKADLGSEMVALSKALKVRSGYEDTHPSLAERLQLLNYSTTIDGSLVELPASPETTAVDDYFGEYAAGWAKQFDREWENDVLPFWMESYKQWGEARKRIGELEGKYERGEINADEKFELAEYRNAEHGKDEAIPLITELIEENPKHAMAKFALGSIFLDDNDEKGIEILEDSMRLDQTLTIPACETLYAYFYSNHREDEALSFMRKADSFQDILQAAEAERQIVSNDDQFESHEIDEKGVEEIAKKVSYHEEIEAAYLVKKKVAYISEYPLNVLGIKTRKNWRGKTVGVSDEDLLNAVVGQVEDIDVHYVVILDKRFKRAKEKIEAIDGALIYSA